MQTRVVPVIALFYAILASGVSCVAAVCVPGFTTLPTFDVGPNVGANALADLNGDGNLDLLTGTAYLLGDGKGGFSERTELLGVPAAMFDVIPRDLDRDGKLDLALIDLWGREVFVLFGRNPDGDRTYLFNEPLVLSSADGTWQIASIDLDEDGFTDLVVSAGRKTLAIHRNNGDRTFQPFVAVHLSELVFAYAFGVGDFDGDGHEDVAASGEFDATIWFGDGTGTLRQTAVVDTATMGGSVVYLHRLCAADLDGDGRSEFLGIGVTLNPADAASLVGYWGSAISSTAGLPARTSFSFELPGGGRFLEIADINRDGMLDLIAQGERVDSLRNFIEILYGSRENGYALEPAPEFETELSGHGSVLAVGDVDNDGYPDIVLTAEDSDLGEVSLNDGSCAPDEAARGDVNVDGRLDIADAVAILSYLFARGFLACRPAADANSSGTLDLADAINILQYLFAAGSPPAPGMVACRK